MIIDCAHFVAGRQEVVPVSLGDAGRLAGEAAGFVWVALSDTAVDDLDELSRAFDLPHFAVKDTPERYQRPKLEHHGENTMLTMKTVRHDETGTQLEIGVVDIVVGARYAIAIGQSSPDALEGASERLRTRPEVATHGPMAAAWAVLDAVIDDTEASVDGLGDQLERRPSSPAPPLPAFLHGSTTTRVASTATASSPTSPGASPSTWAPAQSWCSTAPSPVSH